MLDNQCTPDELERLATFMEQEENKQTVNEWAYEHYHSGNRLTPATPDPELRERLQARLQLILNDHTSILRSPRRQVFSLRRWRIAASIIFLLGLTAYLWMNNSKIPLSAKVTALSDVSPGKDGAILTLADGSRIVLDSIRDGVIALQGGATAKMIDGTLLYEGTGNETLYNTIATPLGRQFQLRLPDGSKVWLNAASSITYPLVFSDTNRSVRITGEAYLEVAGNSRKPFMAHYTRHIDGVKSEGVIEVLGTAFNINAYDDEPVVAATLLEGSVRISERGVATLLEPGEQALLSVFPQAGHPAGVKIQRPNIDQVIAWKNGVFNFHRLHLQQAMRQIARWYDVEIVYEKDIPDIEFGGKMQRSLNLSQIIKGLADADVQFRIDGRQLIVTK